MKKIIVTACSILFALLVAAQLFALDCDKSSRHGMRDKAKHHEETNLYAIFGELNLTAAQKAQVKTSRDAFLREIKPLQDKMYSKRGDLRLLWLETSPEKNKIMTLQREIRALRDQIQDKAISRRLDVFNTLTAEQKEKLKAALAEKRAMRMPDLMRGCEGMLDD